MSIEMIVNADRAEWLKGRKKYLGGSDVACILGLNPWKSNIDLWLEKTGQKEAPDISDKEVVKYGVAAEPILRDLMAITYPKYKMEYQENNSWINSEYPMLKASLDGWLTDEDGRKGIWECKTSEMNNAQAMEKWKDSIPDNYYCQILLYFLVTDFEFAHLTALLTWRREGKENYQQIRHYHVERTEVENDIKYLWEEIQKFWKHIENNTSPARVLPGI